MLGSLSLLGPLPANHNVFQFMCVRSKQKTFLTHTWTPSAWTDQWASTELLVPTENVMEIYWLFHFGTLLKFIWVEHRARRNVEQMSVSILPQATETFAEREPTKDKTRPWNGLYLQTGFATFGRSVIHGLDGVQKHILSNGVKCIFLLSAQAHSGHLYIWTLVNIGFSTGQTGFYGNPRPVLARRRKSKPDAILETLYWTKNSHC